MMSHKFTQLVLLLSIVLALTAGPTVATFYVAYTHPNVTPYSQAYGHTEDYLPEHGWVKSWLVSLIQNPAARPNWMFIGSRLWGFLGGVGWMCEAYSYAVCVNTTSHCSGPGSDVLVNTEEPGQPPSGYDWRVLVTKHWFDWVFVEPYPYDFYTAFAHDFYANEWYFEGEGQGIPNGCRVTRVYP